MIRLEQLVDRVIEAVTDAVPDGVEVGDGAAPPSGEFPFAVVYLITAPETAFSLSAGIGALSVTVQVSSVAASRRQRDRLADTIRAAVTVADLSFDTGTVSDVRVSATNLSDDPAARIWRLDERYSMFVGG